MERTWWPSDGVNSFLIALNKFCATGFICFSEGPVILTLIDREPPTDLPKSDACWANALAPGWALTGLVKIGKISFTRLAFSVAAPEKAPP